MRSHHLDQNQGISQNQYMANGIKLNYYEVENDLPVLVMLHAQGTDSTSFENTYDALSNVFHVFSVDCPDHGSSDKDKSHYNIVSIGDAIIDFTKHLIGTPFYIIGHSSGGLIAAYVASKTKMCMGLIYFEHQKMWDFFPAKSRDKIKLKLLNCAKKYNNKHPDKPLKVPFFPKKALEVYRGMNDYDPYFGDAFYTDAFNENLLHSEILKSITCKTLLMKADTNYDDNNVLLAAMSEEDASLALDLLNDCELVKFSCGHGIHIEKTDEFINALINFVK